MDDPGMILRMSERLLDVAIGGIAIVLGYRLFIRIPYRKSEGSIELPGFKVVLSRVGPGVFFAAFGSIIVWQSVGSQVESVRTANRPTGVEESRFRGALPVGLPASEGALAEAVVSGASEPVEEDIATRRAITRDDVAMLSCIERAASTLDGIAASDVERAVRNAKVALLGSVWDDAWGSRDAFRRWSELGEGEPSPSVMRAYFAIAADCPR